MAGYSKTPLAKKLGIKDGDRVALVGARTGFAAELDPLPDGVTLQSGSPAGENWDVIVVFLASRADLGRRLATLAKQVAQSGGLWAAWPKKASGIRTDLTESFVRSSGLELGLVDNKVCAIDTTWSGLRFVVRLTDRG
ncbi:MAG TPA: hypothetical protein VH142_02195 [Polyangiaceae bacterium]|jgi:hypothetical protein|nr:hypothetical protein [Polyangiaceae bacterium]